MWTGSPTHRGSGNLTTCSAASLLASSHLNVVILTYYGSSRRIENKFIFTTYGSWKEEEHLRVSTGRRYTYHMWQKFVYLGKKQMDSVAKLYLGKNLSWKKIILAKIYPGKNYIGKNLSGKKYLGKKIRRTCEGVHQ